MANKKITLKKPAAKKPVAKKKNKKSSKKYSLNERFEYYDSKLSKKLESTSKLTAKQQYALGFVDGVAGGTPRDFDKLPKVMQNGHNAGVRAKRKSREVKF